MKNDHRWNIFSNLSSGQQYLLNDIKNFRQKWLVKKSKFVWRKKKPTPSTNISLLSYRKSEQKCIIFHIFVQTEWLHLINEIVQTLCLCDLLCKNCSIPTKGQSGCSDFTQAVFISLLFVPQIEFELEQSIF